MRLLDLFCCAGGAAKGYHDAGFTDIIGVDINPQPRYPYSFVQGDALEYVAKFGCRFNAIHASPPCQAYSETQRLMGRSHPDLIAKTRDVLQSLPVHWVIENVPGSPLINPVELCGSMFGLRTYRHRLFEASFPIVAPGHPPHVAPQAKMGRPPKDGQFIHVVGNFSGMEFARKAMGIEWMVRGEMSQAVPPSFTEFIGKQMIASIMEIA